MFKYFICVLIVFVNLNGDDFSNLEKNKADVSEYNQFSTLPDTKEFNYLDKNRDKESVLNHIDEMYQGNSFLTKSEMDRVSKDLFDLKNKLQTSAHTFLFYFTTKDVPLYSITNTLLQLSILQDNQVHIKSKIYMLGLPTDFKDYLMKAREYVDEYPIKYQERVARNFSLKFGPDFFEAYKINKAPALAIAYCSAAIPSVERCHIPYIIRGDVSLEYFLKKISDHNKEYKEYSDIIKNNLINYQKEDKDVL